MNYNFSPDVQFIRGCQTPEDLHGWLMEHQTIMGFSSVGRSNVGKSTLINALFHNSKIARTSKTPGRTQQVNIFTFKIKDENGVKDQLYYFFDLPGYGHAKVSKAQSKNWGKLMEIFFQSLPPQVALCLIQDSRHPHQKADQGFLEFVKQIHGKHFLIYNKIDKLRQKDKAVFQKQLKELMPLYKNFHLTYQISAERNIGLEEFRLGLLNYLVSMLE